MQIRQILCTVGVSLLTGIAGYTAHCWQRDGSALALSQVPGLEIFTREQSFSEVQNAKALLQGLSERYIVELRVQQSAGMRKGDASPHTSRQGAIQDLRERIEEFRGTEQQWALTHELLLLLKRENHQVEWLQTYLDVVYAQPEAELIARFAPEAVSIAASLDRLTEVQSAYGHLLQIPRETPVKEQVRRTMASLAGLPPVAPTERLGS